MYRSTFEIEWFEMMLGETVVPLPSCLPPKAIFHYSRMRAKPNYGGDLELCSFFWEGMEWECDLGIVMGRDRWFLIMFLKILYSRLFEILFFHTVHYQKDSGKEDQLCSWCSPYNGKWETDRFYYSKKKYWIDETSLSCGEKRLTIIMKNYYKGVSRLQIV